MFRQYFPMLAQLTKNSHNNIVYLDSAATTLKPRRVINAVVNFYETSTANVHRGTHLAAERASAAFESTREKVASFLGARTDEVVFTANATDGFNLVASGLELAPSDEVIVSVLEHHSNWLPWSSRACVKVAPVDREGRVNVERLESLIGPHTRLISCTALSNVTGNIQPVADVVAVAKKHHLISVIDAAQAVGHVPVNLRQWDCDFLIFSGHKMFAPSGVGIMYGRRDRLKELKPARLGGGMVNRLGDNRFIPKEPPFRLEGGTPNIEGVIGLGAALDFISEHGLPTLVSYLQELDDFARATLCKARGFAPAFPMSRHHTGIYSLVPTGSRLGLDFISRHLSDVSGIAISAGFQCCQPLYKSANTPGALRCSLHVYNTKEDIQLLVEALETLAPLLTNRHTHAQLHG